MAIRKHLNVKIYGLVQGVFYRHSAKRTAEEIGIYGFARNEPDGSVYIEAEGEEENLKEFLKWSKKGPPLASVSEVKFNFENNLKNFTAFRIEGG